MSNDMPEQPKTKKELPAVSSVEIAIAKLTAIVEERFDDVDDRFREFGIRIALVTTDLGVVKSRLEVVESRQNDSDQRAAKNSGGVRGLSQSDANQDLQIASIAVKVDALTESQGIQTTIIRATADDVKAFLATPTVKIVGGVLFGFFSKWFADHYGIELPK